MVENNQYIEKWLTKRTHQQLQEGKDIPEVLMEADEKTNYAFKHSGNNISSEI